LLALLACGASKSGAGLDAAPVREACRSARELRAAATELERTGHLLLARGKLDEANTTCPEERASSGGVEAKVLADLGECAKATVVPMEGDAGTVAEVKTLCDARTAASKGTEATLRAKMREAFAAAQVKDYARAKSLFLDAWTEHHPSPLSLEDAGRMASLAGDSAGARRARDRALVEAEAMEHVTALVTNRVRASEGAARLVGGTLTIAERGKVVARDLATGELRVLLDRDGNNMTLSPLGTLAFTTTRSITEPDDVRIYDLLTGGRLLDGEHLTSATASNDDALVVVRGGGNARVVDVASGEVRAKLEGDAFTKLWMVGFGPGSTVVVYDPGKDDGYTGGVFRMWDTQKNALGAFLAPAARPFAGVSVGGRYLVTLGHGENDAYDAMPLGVRDLETGKVVAEWTGLFGFLTGVSVTPDAKTVATASQNSVRLWDVAAKKQTFIAARTRRGDNYDSDLGRYAFSDDGKTIVLGREARTMLWDVATGVETEVVSNQREKDVLRVVPLGEAGVVLVMNDEVRVVPLVGDAHTICRGFHQRFYPDVGPTNAVVSPTGKSVACSMSGGAVHVFDTATWQERSRIDAPVPGSFKQGFGGFVWDGVPPTVRPVDLAFSPDDASLTVVSDTTITTYDASTGKQSSKVTLRAPKLVLAARHARFEGGRVLVKTSSGSGAIFDAAGAFDREVKLVAGAPIDAPDAFSADGKTYAVAIRSVLHTVDMDSGADHTTDLPIGARTLALSPDGKASLIVGTDGAVYQPAAGSVTKLEPGPAKRAFFAGKAMVAVTGSGDTLELLVTGRSPRVLEVDPNGLVARSATGTFEARGKPEAECIVGHVMLTLETCADRAESGLVEAWPQGLVVGGTL